MAPVHELNAAGPSTIERVFPSEMLAGLVRALRSAPDLARFVKDVIRVRIVLDANSVHDELSFRLRRRSPVARTDLREMIDAGVVEAFIPRFLDGEIAEHAQEIGERFGKTAEEVWAAYLEFRPRLRPYDPQEAHDPVAAEIDPDDVLYKRVFEELGADVVLTQDKHFKEMKVPSLGRMPRALREYARSSSVSIGIACGSGFVLVLGFGSLKGLCAVVDVFLSAIGRLPDWAKLLLAGSFAALIVHPASREKLKEQWTRLCEGMVSLASALGPFLGEIAVVYVTASDQAKRISEELRHILPETRPKTAIQLIRLILLTSVEPMSIAEIAVRMRGEGLSGGDENLGQDIEKELRGSVQFIEAAPGQWILRDRAGEYVAKSASAPPPGPTLPLGSIKGFTMQPFFFTGMSGTDSLTQIWATGVSFPSRSPNGTPIRVRRRKRVPARRGARVLKSPTPRERSVGPESAAHGSQRRALDTAAKVRVEETAHG